MSSGKRRVYSVSGRHHDDHWRNACDIFRKAYIAFIIFRVLTEIAEVKTDIALVSVYRNNTNQGVKITFSLYTKQIQAFISNTWRSLTRKTYDGSS